MSIWVVHCSATSEIDFLAEIRFDQMGGSGLNNDLRHDCNICLIIESSNDPSSTSADHETHGIETNLPGDLPKGPKARKSQHPNRPRKSVTLVRMNYKILYKTQSTEPFPNRSTPKQQNYALNGVISWKIPTVSMMFPFISYLYPFIHAFHILSQSCLMTKKLRSTRLPT